MTDFDGGPGCRRAWRRRPCRPAAEPRLRQGGPAGRHLRHEPGHAGPHRGRRDAVHGVRRGRTPARTSADRSSGVRIGRDDDRANGSTCRRHRDAGRRIPWTVDDDLREGGRSDRAAPGHEPGHARPHRGRRDAVHGERRRRTPARTPADRSPGVRVRRDHDRADGSARRRHRDAGRRVPRTVDDDLREGGRPDRAAPARAARWSSCAARSTRGPPGTSPSTSRTAAAIVDRRVLSRSGSPRATPSRSSTRCRRSSARTPTPRPTGRRPCSADSPPRPFARRPRKPSSRSCSRTRGAT